MCDMIENHLQTIISYQGLFCKRDLCNICKQALYSNILETTPDKVCISYVCITHQVYQCIIHRSLLQTTIRIRHNSFILDMTRHVCAMTRSHVYRHTHNHLQTSIPIRHHSFILDMTRHVHFRNRFICMSFSHS